MRNSQTVRVNNVIIFFILILFSLFLFKISKTSWGQYIGLQIFRILAPLIKIYDLQAWISVD